VSIRGVRVDGCFFTSGGKVARTGGVIAGALRRPRPVVGGWSGPTSDRSADWQWLVVHSDLVLAKHDVLAQQF
jgi:hypothetical protein